MNREAMRKLLEESTPQIEVRYTQSYLLAEFENAFNAAMLLPLKSVGIIEGYDRDIFRFPTFQDYLNFKLHDQRTIHAESKTDN